VNRPDSASYSPSANRSWPDRPAARRDWARQPDSERGIPPTLKRRIPLFLVAVLGAAMGFGLVHLPVSIVFACALGLLFAVLIVLQPFIGLLIYTVIFMLRVGELYPVLAPLHLERVVGAFTMVAIFLEQYRKERRLLIDDSRQTRLFLLFLLAVAMSVPLAYWRQAAVNGFVAMLKIACFYVMIVQCVNTRARLRGWVLTFALFVLYIAATSLHAYMTGGARFTQGIDRAIGVTSAGGDANTLGTTLASALPLFMLVMADRAMRWWRLLAASGAVVLVVTQLVTGSRASLLGLLCGLAWMWWTSRRRVAPLLVGLAIALVGLSILPEQYKERYSSITRSEIDASSQGRVDAWHTGLRMFVDRPLFGVGIGCFGAAHGTVYSTGPVPNWLEAHSLYVQIVAELGLVGTIAFLLLLREMLRLNRSTSRWLSARGPDAGFEVRVLDAMAAGFVVLLVSGIFGHSLTRETWYVFAAAGIAILRIDARSADTAEPQPARDATGAPVLVSG
jgi:probable O-glycosylation ligase (exosortase A-associated)